MVLFGLSSPRGGYRPALEAKEVAPADFRSPPRRAYRRAGPDLSDASPRGVVKRMFRACVSVSQKACSARREVCVVVGRLIQPRAQLGVGDHHRLLTCRLCRGVQVWRQCQAFWREICLQDNIRVDCRRAEGQLPGR